MLAKGQPAVEKMLCWGRFFLLCSAGRNRRRTTLSKFWPSCRCASVLRFMEELLLRMARRPHVPLANFKLSPNASLGGWTMRAAADSAFDCTNKQLLSRLHFIALVLCAFTARNQVCDELLTEPSGVLYKACVYLVQFWHSSQLSSWR